MQAHTHSHTHTHTRTQIIEKVLEGDHASLARREIYWQNQLKCYVENGGQGHCYRKEI